MRIAFFTVLVAAMAGMAYAAKPADPATTGNLSAVVQKPSVQVRSQPDFKATPLATLQRNAPVSISGQQGLWYRLKMPAGAPGYLRVNEVRMAYASVDNSAGAGVLFSGKSGSGRASETAGVRGLDEGDLRSASADPAQLAKMQSYRATPAAADAYAGSHGLSSTAVAYATEAQPSSKGNGMTQAQKRSGLSIARGLLSQFGGLSGNADAAANVADAAAGKSETEQSDEELALGPELASRILGAAPLWRDDAAQRRVNMIGRWMASHTSRPELPWTFGVIDSSDINAFAAPGGYVLMTRGLYRLLDSDAELAAALGHEISHIVQRDHYNVIRKQEMATAGKNIASSRINVGGGIAGAYAKEYVEKNGAAVMLTSLDRGAEYRSDEASQVYLARSGYNPMALYSVLQKMTALGGRSTQMAQLFKTHPSLGDRLDQIDRRGYGALEPYLVRQ